MKKATLRAPGGERLMEGLIRVSAGVAIAALLLIFLFIGKEALPVLTSPKIKAEVSMSRMLLPVSPAPGVKAVYSWQPVSKTPKYSLPPLFVGTIKVTLVSMIFALPLALSAAIFTSEFAPPTLKEFVKPAIELLAGIPSVVLGFFALIVMADIVQKALSLDFRLNCLTTGLALGLAVIPIVYTVSEDALSAVPQSFRDGSQALGATSWQTAWRVVLPGAFPGIFAACVLGFGRAVGETMIVLMASGNAAVMSWNPAHPFRNFSATIAAELGEVVRGSPHYHALFFIGVLLFIFTFLLNLLAQWFVGKFRRRLSGTA